MARKRVIKRTPQPEPAVPLPTIPREGRFPRSIPPTTIPEIRQPPVPRMQFTPEVQAALNRLPIQTGQFRTTPPTLGPITSVYGPQGFPGAPTFGGVAGPGIRFGRGRTRTDAITDPLTQADLPQTAGLTPSEMFALNVDPYKPTRGRVAFGALMSALSHGALPPFISFAGQSYIGLSDEDLAQNYVRGENGWIRLERGQAVATGGGDGEVEYVNYIPSYGGGGSARTNRSGLVNWRI